MKVKEDNPQVYELYGLRVHSELPLPALLSERALPPYDLRVRWGEGKTIPANPNSVRLLARQDIGDKPFYTLIDTGGGYAFSLHQCCEFWISYDLRLVDAYLFPDVQPDIAGFYIISGVIAFILSLSGECVLHASAVEMGGRAVAFAAGAGMGKSTLAAIFCAMGAQFITDDLLRLKPDKGTFYCFPGTGRIRLRNGAAALAEEFPAKSPGKTSYGRVELKLHQNHSMPPLHAIVIPRTLPDCQVFRLERLPAARAVLYLMNYSKTQGLQQRGRIQRKLDFMAQLASSIPVFEAEIPWGIPLLREAVPSLAGGVGLEFPKKILLSPKGLCLTHKSPFEKGGLRGIY
jgi:hypothetical protein